MNVIARSAARRDAAISNLRSPRISAAILAMTEKKGAACRALFGSAGFQPALRRYNEQKGAPHWTSLEPP
ncbi:MAG: hypothetical protein HY804_12240 [Nitrospinae bacterium]|nr:hypothetical protein [Nitrospinota bacterium]